MIQRFITCLAALTLVFAVVAPAHSVQSNPFQQNNQFLSVDQAFDFDSEVNDSKVTVSWVVAPEYYLYQHRFKVVPENALAAEPELPQGESHSDEFFGESIVYRDYVEWSFTLNPEFSGNTITVQYQGCADAGLCYPPTEKQIKLSSNSETSSTTAPPNTDSSLFGIGEQHLIITLLLFFALGIGLAFTPCVFPMYPILSGVVLGNRERNWKNTLWLSFIYVQGMAITYSLLGLVVASAGMQYQAYFQHPVVLIVLAALFALFALSMFGAYTLQLPISWQSKLQSFSGQQSGGNVVGVFIIGAISGLVASPCTTAPLSGALLFIAQSGDMVSGVAILYALSLGMGVPLILFGLSGGKLLPKAGAWMNVVKQFFGWLLLAVTLFLIERLIPTSISMWLWIFYFILAAVSLAVSISQPLRITTKVITIVLLAAAATTGSYWQVNKAQLEQKSHGLFTVVSNVSDIQQQVAESDRWVMLDLYADWCVACKEFEQYTFSDEQVQAQFQEFKLIQADVTRNNAQDVEILSRYKVLGLPTILFFDPEGNERPEYRVTGYMNAEDFKKHLEKIVSE
ncbi:thiol:disulfide interchange protein DsbD [Idiomarina loihiensis]|uniref:protein-disulfide reductase DsbD n=1 Tax=Idiomarina TaxID=135575 RepID=UPI000D71884C|nr:MULTISPECIES: protein-disulfide reductase DsbD [Idiomarina]PWW38314.1 thiol:disulfide interchange protein DsbD [Idiomarina loihiensis]TDP48612.1 thiol:disulfide interchange protein DsbD [Idiomarina loihiensis]TDS23778.1 thiol:disulfide interchange protein DsbD [Idiomarina sp. H2]